MATNNNQNTEEAQRLQRFYDHYRQDTVGSIAADTNHDWLIQNIMFGIEWPGQAWLKTGIPRSDLQLEMHLKDLWWRSIEAAKLYPADDEGRQYKLVAWIAGAKARGPVPSLQQDPYMADGGKVLWQDLPFFETALDAAWAAQTTMTNNEWTNLNAFVSRLSAVTGMDLLRLGLQTIRDALETARPVFSTSEDQPGQGCIADLLPAACFWLLYSHASIQTTTIMFERAAKAGAEPPPGRGSEVPPGELAQAHGVSRSGMSLARRRFWRLRLLEIASDEGSGSGPEGDTTRQDAHVWARRLGT